MSYTDENGVKCRCSRNRKCGLHAQAAKQMARVARPVIEARRVEVGIEALRAKYAKTRTSPPAMDTSDGKRRTSRGWSKQ